MTGDLPRITDEDDWLDLRDGEEALVLGKLDGIANLYWTVVFPNWSQLVIAIDHMHRPPLQLRRCDIKLRVQRRGDEVHASPFAIADAIKEMEGRINV